MSEKLTVAELLARSGRTPTDDKDRPRRRRRSLEQGGVSVAELTGSIPVVKDEHLEADDAAQANEADKAREREEAERKKAEEQRKAEAERKARAEREAAERKRAEEQRKVEAERKVQAEREAAERKKAEEQRKAEAERKAQAERQKNAATASPASERNKSGVDRVAENKSSGSTPAARPVGAATGAATGMGAASKLAQDAKDEDSKDKAAAKSGKRVASGSKKRSGKSDKAVALSDHEEVQKLKDGLGEHEVLEYEDDQISWPAMIVQALLAIVVGVGVFFGFSMLWDRMGTGIVLILALAVTLFLVGIVHAILRHKDKWILLLALVVGLVLTVGPRLILGM